MGKKSHSNMDKTSAAQARWLDQLREANKKKQARKKFDKSSLSRGGFR